MFRVRGGGFKIGQLLQRTTAVDHALSIIAGRGLERFIPEAPINLHRQTADGLLVDAGQELLGWTCDLLADRGSQGGLAIGYLESILCACAKYDPLHDEWNQVVVCQAHGLIYICGEGWWPTRSSKASHDVL